METVITVQADSREACEAEFARQVAMGAEPRLLPRRMLDRWMARAAILPPDPAERGRA